MKETNRHDEMLKVQRDREEADQKIKKGDMTEEEALEINLKANPEEFWTPD
jgi:hypothetical protein